MRRMGLIIGAAVAMTWGASASAGLYSDDLARCLVAKSSDADKITLMQWMFSAMTAHPAVQSMTNITATQREAFTKKGADLFQRLMFVDCRTETVGALKNEGSPAIEAGFQVLGQVAARGLMSDPAVAAQMGSVAKAMDASKLAALAKEAGTQPAK